VPELIRLEFLQNHIVNLSQDVTIFGETFYSNGANLYGILTDNSSSNPIAINLKSKELDVLNSLLDSIKEEKNNLKDNIEKLKYYLLIDLNNNIISQAEYDEELLLLEDIKNSLLETNSLEDLRIFNKYKNNDIKNNIIIVEFDDEKCWCGNKN
jgi:hypothetical protein